MDCALGVSLLSYFIIELILQLTSFAITASNEQNLHMLQDIKKCRPPPPISFGPGPTIFKKPDKKRHSLRFDINTFTEEINIKTVSLYILIFKTGLTKALLKLLVVLNIS